MKMLSLLMGDANIIIEKYLIVFGKFGAALLGFILFTELVKVGFNFAFGRPNNFDQKLIITYIIVTALVAGYPAIQDKAQEHGERVVISMNNARVDFFIASIKQLLTVHDLNQAKDIENDTGGFTLNPIKIAKYIIIGLAFLLIQLLTIITHFLIEVTFFGYYVGFLIISSLGPLFLLFFLSSSTSGWGESWLSKLLSQFITLVLIIIAMEIVHAILLRSSGFIYGTHTGSPDLAMLIPAIANFMYIFVVIRSVPKVTDGFLSIMGR